ncbi:MAG: response regulator, partial [Bryobacteraceae bacterium]
MKEAIRIMVVEDHHIVRHGLVALLGMVPDLSVVAEASDGAQAVELFREHRPDITLMDLRLPVMSGVEAVERIRREFPTAR